MLNSQLRITFEHQVISHLYAAENVINMERVDNLTCEGCLHMQIKEFTKKDPRHCIYCLRNHGESRYWQPESGELLMYLMDCYINLSETSLPTLISPIVESPLKGKPRKKENISLT